MNVMLGLLAVIAATTGEPQDPPRDPLENPTAPLHELAASADVVAIVQVDDTDYEYARDIFPVKGKAWLKVLIPYKGAERDFELVVPEEGLEEDNCYYPDLENEGQRFLAFLRQKPDETYRGWAVSCAMPVLVTSDHRYALLYPVGERPISEELVETIDYADPAARIDPEPLTQAEVAELKARYEVREEVTEVGFFEEVKLVYTRGIGVRHMRSLLFPPEADAAD